jgi:hypothetical protein
VCSSPRLIAAYHVLHRLLAPRHPPYTLSNLTALIQSPDPTIEVLFAPCFTAWQRTVQVIISFYILPFDCSLKRFATIQCHLLSANLNIHSSIFKEPYDTRTTLNFFTRPRPKHLLVASTCYHSLGPVKTGFGSGGRI